jgi:hypothetical protein
MAVAVPIDPIGGRGGGMVLVPCEPEPGRSCFCTIAFASGLSHATLPPGWPAA